MSIEAMDWAKQQKCGSPSIKAVLMEIANWTNPEGRAEFRLVRDIAHVVEMSERNVQRIIARLEQSREEGGLGLLQRVPVFGQSGVQRANGFLLVGFKGRVTSCHPTASKRVSGEGDRLSPPRVTDCHREGDAGVTGEGDAGVTPYLDLDQEQDNSPPPPKGAERARTGSSIPDDWKVPNRNALPAPLVSLVTQWPQGAYEAEGEAFAQHWRGNGRRKADWSAAWASRVQARHSAVMRDAKAGVTFTAPSTPAAGTDAEDLRPVVAKRDEDERSEELHFAIARRIGQPLWEQWYARVALIFHDCGLTVVAPTAFHQSWLETRHKGEIEHALGKIGRGVDWIAFKVDQKSNKAAEKQARSGGRKRAR